MRVRVSLLLVAFVLALSAASAWAEVERITPSDARFMVKTGRALLICAYEDVQKCTENRLEGSIDLVTLRRVERALRRDFTLIFYCT